MVTRSYWLNRLEQAWQRHSVVWLSGVRRAGKTVLCQGLSAVEYFDCELPRVRALMEDPEAFWQGLRGKLVALDEVHRLRNPSELLKIAADHFPDVRVMATGSSTLQASAKFRDTLTGRKSEVWLTPMNAPDLRDFDRFDLAHRLQFGGLPPFFLSAELPEADYQDWMDSYWAKDIQELFRLERRDSFQRFFELLMAQSGGIFEATRLAAPCEVSRTTIANYLKVLEATRVVHVVRPYATRATTEIISAPKVYGFDTGFVCYHKGWYDLRREDLGALWEHYVLNELHSRAPQARIHYWRDRRGHEVDFILLRRGASPVPSESPRSSRSRPGAAPIAIECKWSALGSDQPTHLGRFRAFHPEGETWIVAADVDRPFSRDQDGFRVDYIGIDELARRLSEPDVQRSEP